MFLTLELAAILVEAPLGYTPRTYRKPYMIRLVIFVDPLAVFGVRLDKPPVMVVSLDLLDARSPLTL
jgi:hypothetical protein